MDRNVVHENLSRTSETPSTGTTQMTDKLDLREIRRAAALVLYGSTATKSDVIQQFTRLATSQSLLNKLR